MLISLKQDNITVAVELEENSLFETVSCEDVLIAAYDIISRVFSEEAVVKAYYRTDPDTMTFREKDDPVLKMCPQKG
jgi:hypothetical protein